MAFSQIPTSSSILSSGLKGYLAISLTNWTTSALSNISSGSACEIGNAFFLAGTELTVNASSWTAVTTSTTAFMELTPAGSAGAQTITAAWDATDPTWDEAKQGWYHSATSLIRTIGSAYKVSNTQQETKTLYTNGRGRLFTKSINIGDWNMDSTTNVLVTPLISLSRLREYTATIRDDADAQYFKIDYNPVLTPSTASVAGWIKADTTGITVQRVAGGWFDSTDYNATSYNRGWVIITYEA